MTLLSPDPRQTLLASPMSPYQWTAVLVTVALCALDGFDVLAVTLAAPGVVKAWHVSKAELGVVFSLGLAGMAAGSLVVAPLADAFGRRPLVLASLLVMSIGMAMCAQAGSVAALGAWRVVTGVGIGATVAIINPLAAEYANARRRDLAIGLMTVGFPIGGVLGGWAAAILLAQHDWPVVFQFGAGLGLALIPLVLWRLPESMAFLIEAPGRDALVQANRFLARCGHLPVAALPEPHASEAHAPLLALFTRGQRRQTLAITLINLLFVMSVYFFLSWTPQMVADLGFRPAVAAEVSAGANLAGIMGGALLGGSAGRLGLKPLAFAALLGMGAATMAFGFASADLTTLRVSAAVTGFFLFGGMAGLYAVVSRTFPTPVRASGTGFVIGVGRIGSALAPAVAGLLFAQGLGRGGVSLAMGACAVAAALLFLAFPVPHDGAAESRSS